MLSGIRTRFSSDATSTDEPSSCRIDVNPVFAYPGRPGRRSAYRGVLLDRRRTVERGCRHSDCMLQVEAVGQARPRLSVRGI